MAKRKVKYRKQSTSLIEKVQNIAQFCKDENHKRDAQTIVNYYIRNGRFPDSMRKRAFELSELNGYVLTKEQKKPRSKRHYLYAISNGEELKVGFSVNPDSRIRTMQTGNPKKLEIVWRTYCANSPREATVQEKKLHRRIKEHKIRGEWFDIKALPTIKAWQVRNNCTEWEEKVIQRDEEILANLPTNF